MFRLEKYSLTELKDMAEKMDLPVRRSKTEMIQDISKAFQEYEEYKKEKKDKYTRKHQLGEKGKEGTTFLVVDKKGKEYAMKTFRKSKSSNTLTREYQLQKKASKEKIAPKVYDYDTVGKWIVMQKMDSHLFENITALDEDQQKSIIRIFKKLDKVGVFHNDANIINFMVRKGRIYLIDYGFAKEITPKLIKTLGTDRPNYKLMTIGMVLKLRELNFPRTSYKYFLSHISEEDKQKYGF
jgi:predicted Ser/Thr protein kinase